MALSHLIRRGDASRYTKKAASAYSVNDLGRLFAVCSPEEKLLFEFFLGSGTREGEVTYACWSDINFDAGLFTIRAKPDLGWTLKDRESDQSLARFPADQAGISAGSTT